MKNLFEYFGGAPGIKLRLNLTVVYSLTSIVALFVLYLLVDPVVRLSDTDMMIALPVLFAVLGFDLIGQTLYNERIFGPIFRFLRLRASGQLEDAVVEEAASSFVAAPRKVAFSSFLFWIFSTVVVSLLVWGWIGVPWNSAVFLFIAGLAGSFVALIFQYSLFRRVMTPTGSLLMQHRYTLDLLHDSLRIGARARLMVTFLVLVVVTLVAAGLLTYSQYSKVSGEQAGLLAAAYLSNLGDELPTGQEELHHYLAEQEAFFDFSLATIASGNNRVVGNLPVDIEYVRDNIRSRQGNFDHPASMSRVTYRSLPDNRILVAVTPAEAYMVGSQKIIWVSLLIILLTLVGAGFIFNMVVVDIVRPFAELREYAKDLSQGAIRHSPIIVTEDEFGRLDGALRKMGLGLRVMFLDLASSLGNVKRTREELTSELREIQSHSQIQDRQVDQAFMSFSSANQALRDIRTDIEVIESAADEAESSLRQLENFLSDIRSELLELLDLIRSSGRALHTMDERVETSRGGVIALNEGINGLGSQIGRMQSKFDELSNLMDGVVDNSSATLALATAADTASRTTDEGVTELYDATASLLAQLQDFRVGIKEITDVVEIISEVTEQTGLLAFNAAILAAESNDDHAKDFAVVGDEIKDLAERTESSTKDVGVVMGHVHNRSFRSFDEMRESLGRIQQGQLLTRLACDSIGLIGRHSADNDRDIVELRQGIQYQYQNLSRIVLDVQEEVKRVGSLREYTEENKQGSDGLRNAVLQLVHVVERLQHTTGEQSESNRHLVYVLKQISEGISGVKRDVRKLSESSVEVVDLMNDIRYASSANRTQSEGMSAQLKRLDGLLRDIDSKISVITVG